VPLLREIFQPLIGDTLCYDFGKYQARIRQGGWDYPRHEIMTWIVSLTQYRANPNRLEFEITQE
jgi:hypothetical protein